MQWSDKLPKSPDNLVPEANIDFFKGRPELYKNQLKDIKFKAKPGPTFGEVQNSIPKFAYESFKCKLFNRNLKKFLKYKNFKIKFS